MSHSLRPKSERTSQASDLPSSLADAIAKVRKDVADVEAWEDLNELCREHDRPDEAAALYTETLDTPLETEALEDIGRLAADFCEEWYEETAPTLEMLQSVLAQDVNQTWAFERLTVLLTVASEWDALLAAYDRSLEATEDKERQQELLEEAAKVARDFAGKPQRGSDYLKALLLLRLDDEQLASTLERRFDEQERHEDLIEIWTARLPILSKDSELKTRLQIAQRHLDFLEDGENAFVAVQAFLEAEGSESEGCSVLERLADKEEIDAEVRRKALTTLEGLHTAAERWEQVISVTERALVLAEDESASAALHARAVDLHERLGQVEQALSHCGEIMQLQPDADDVRERAKGLAAQIGELGTYADAVVMAADGASEGSRRVELLVEAAQVRRVELDDAVSATDIYFRIEKDEDADDAARLLACQELSELLQAADRREELLLILEKRADLEGKAEERKRILGEAARLATSLGEGERALGLWSLRLNDENDDDEALSAKIDLFGELEKFQGLVEALTARSRVGDDQQRQRDDLVRAASVFAERLGDLESGIESWRTVEKRFGRTDETLDSLVALSSRAEKHEQVVTLLKEAIEVGGGGERTVAQLGQLGDTQRLHIQDNPEAFKSYRHALELEPQSETAIAGVQALMVDPDLAHFAGEALAGAFRRSGELAQLVGLLEVRLGAAPDDAFKAKVLLEAAGIEEQAENLPAAMNALARAFAIDPTEATEAELHRLAAATEDFQRATAAYAEAISALGDDERVGDLYSAKGKLEEEQLGDAVAATASYRAAVERAPSDAETVFALVRAGHLAHQFSDAAWAIVENSRVGGSVSTEQIDHYAEQAQAVGDWEGSLEGLADRIASSDGLDPQVAHDLKKQLAIWYRDRLDDPDSAEMVLKRAVQDHPQEDSLRVLAELQRRTPGKPLVLTLTSLADVCSDVLVVLKEAASVALDPVGDSELARPLLERALKLASEEFVEAGGMETDEGFDSGEAVNWATDHLVTVSLQEQKLEEAVALLEKSAELPFTPADRISRRFRAAEVAADGGLDERAVELCDAILDAEGKHEGAITLLSTLHEKAGRLDQLLDLRKRELSLERPQERRLFLRLDQARVLGQTGAKSAVRITALEENLEDLPGHEDTIFALQELLTAEESFETLVSVLETQARAIADSEGKRASALWAEAGQLAEEKLEDEARLAANYKLSAAAHATIPVVDRLALIAEAEERWDAEVSWLQLRVSLTPEVGEADETADRRQVVERLGNALIRNDDRGAARVFLEGELAKDAPADASRQVLAQIYRDLEEWQELASLLEAGVEFAPDEAAQIEYLRSAAQVQRKRLSNLEAASGLLQRAMTLAPEDRGLKLALADTLRSAEDYEPAAQILSGLLEEFGRRRTKERAVVHTQLARIAHASGDLDEALEQAEAAAKIERTDAEILMLVGQLARAKGLLEKAEQAYRTLALIASRKSPKKKGDEGESVGESTILFELYRISQEKGDEKQSRELLDSALEVATRDPEEAMRLSESLRAAGQVDLLLDALQQRLDGGLEGAVAASVLVTRANVLEQSEKEGEALLSRLQALENSPGDGRLIDTTQRLAEKIGASQDFWAHIQHLAESNEGSPQVAGDLWFRAGRAVEEEGGDLVRAAEFYELAQETGHKPKRCFLALDRTLDEGSDPERVQGALRRFVTSDGAEASPDVLSDALYRLADFELAAGSIEEGAAHLMQGLEVDAQDERALEMLEPIVRGGHATDRVVILFLRVARKAASQETLLFAFRCAAKAQTVEMAVLEEAIGLARQLDDGDALRELLSRTVEVGEATEALQSVSALVVERASLARSDEEFDLESVLLRKAIPCFDGEDKFELELRLAACLVDNLGQIEKGQGDYERLLEEAPTDGRVWRPLMAIYRASGRTEAVEELISAVEEHVTEESDLEALKMERVRLMVGEDRLEEAEVELRKTLEERPHMADAAEILAELLRKAERWDELKELVENLLDRARDREDTKLVAKFGMELAQLVVEEDRERAMEILTSGLPLAKGNRSYLVYALSLYTEEDNQSEKADVMEHLLALQRGPEARDLALELYTLHEELGDSYNAGRALEIGVGVAPEEATLVGTYEEHLRNQGEHEKLASVLELQANQFGKTEAGALKYAEAAALYDEELGNPEKAASAIGRAYECDSSNLAYLEKGAQYLVNIGQVDQALENLKVAIATGDETALPDLLELRANIIRSERPGDRAAMTQAADDIRRALGELIPEEQEDSLQGARVEVLGELRGLHQAEDDVQSERAVILELSETLQDIGDTPGSIDTLTSWVRDHEDDLQVAETLGKKATESDDHSAAMFAYEKMVAATEGEPRVDAILHLADAAEAAGQPMEAQAALESAFAEDSANERLRERLRTMYEAAGAYEDLANILMAEADKSEDPSVRSTLLVDVGDLYLKADKGEDACSMYEQALELAEAPYEITSKLALAYVALGDVERAESVLNDAVATHGKRRSPQLALLQHGLAKVADASGDIAGMFTWLEAALMSDRNNGDVAQELAVRAQEAERFDIAIKALQSLTLSKGKSPMSKAEAYFRQAQISQAQGDAKKALLMARRAHAADAELEGLAQLITEVGG